MEGPFRLWKTLERLRDAEARERILQEQNDAFDAIGAQMSERIRVLEQDLEAAKILLSLDKGASLADGIALLILENDRFREEVERQKKIEETLRGHLDHLSSLGSKTKLIY